jgi:hypothetical protein
MEVIINERSIAYGKKSFPGFHYNTNNLLPPLSYTDGHFALVYSISVFTHLSEKNGLLWSDEIYRVLGDQGVFAFTTNGIAKTYDFSNLEIETLRKHGILERSSSLEGKKWFSAYHSDEFVTQRLCNNFEILFFEKASEPFYGQDVWVARRKSK